MASFFVIFAILAFVLTVPREFARRRSLSAFAARACAGHEWHRAFPDAGTEDTRAFLQLFADAFSLSPKYALKFRPSDSVMDVYRAVNPPKWTFADQLEVETFALMLAKRYGLELKPFWRDGLTLGEVFRLINAGQRAFPHVSRSRKTGTAPH